MKLFFFTSRRQISSHISRLPVIAGVFVFAGILLSASIGTNGQQNLSAPTQFRVGERVTYSVSFDRYPNAGFAELHVVSRGKLSGRDAVELSGSFKTLGLYSAQNLIDEGIVSFVDAESGTPLYVKRTSYSTGLPLETINNFLETPAAGFDLLSLIYKIRYSSTGGAVTFINGDRTYSVTYQQTGSETVKTGAGDFDTTVFEVQGGYLAEIGIQSFRINIDNVGNRVPVMLRAKMGNGEFKASAASIQILAPEPDAVPTPTAFETPRPTPTPVAVPTPETYIDNRPLGADLPFALGERIEYRILYAGQNAGRLVLEARERKRFNGSDSLMLTAAVANANMPQTAFSGNDRMTAQVDPVTLLPQRFEAVFSGNLAAFSQSAVFDAATSSVSFGGANRVDVPVGTHSVLSLLYAMRSFKLNPSRDLNDPVNDTRVAVFWGTRPYVFVLRPTSVELAGPDGAKVPAILATITTGEPQFDQLQPKVWIGQDARKLPVRIQLGQYIFDLDRVTNNPPR